MKIFDFLHNTKTQAILAYITVIGVGTLLVFGHLTEGINNRILDIALLTATFYFGGSKSSAAKDETIATLSSNQAPAIGSSENTTVQINPKQNEKPEN